MNTGIRIGTRAVGLDAPPFVIAEMSGNHNGSLDRALAIVDAVAASGAQAMKLQTYTADTMTIDSTEREFVIDDPDEPVDRTHALRPVPRGAHALGVARADLRARAPSTGWSRSRTPFDATAVDFLEALDVPATRSRRSRSSTCR